MAKALDENRFDGEGRRLGERSGLDTRNFREISVQASKFRSENYIYLLSGKIMEICLLSTRVVLAVNAAGKVLHILREYAVSKRRR